MEKRREFGKWLQEKRLQAGYTQSQIAKKLKFNTKGNIVGYENGISPVPLERIFDLTEAYNIDIQEMLGKLAEHEPQLYKKFCRLEERYFKHFSHEFEHTRLESRKGESLHNTNYHDINGARQANHHSSFPNTFNSLIGHPNGLKVNNNGIIYIIRHFGREHFFNICFYVSPVPFFTALIL